MSSRWLVSVSDVGSSERIRLISTKISVCNNPPLDAVRSHGESLLSNEWPQQEHIVCGSRCGEIFLNMDGLLPVCS